MADSMFVYLLVLIVIAFHQSKGFLYSVIQLHNLLFQYIVARLLLPLIYILSLSSKHFPTHRCLDQLYSSFALTPKISAYSFTMKKPSDNLRHQLLKYLVDRASRTSSTTTARHPYTTNLPNTFRIPIIYAPTNNMFSSEGYDWDEPVEPSLTAINITIDTSINIAGDKNTITLAGHATNRVIESTHANNVDPQQHGQEQLVQLATTAINALKDQDLTEGNGRKRPITIELKRGVTIKGIDNKVCLADPQLAAHSADSEDDDTMRSHSVCIVDLCPILRAYADADAC